MQRAGLPSAGVLPRRPVHNSICMVQSVLTNHTGRGGSREFPVVTPVSFRDLTLVYTYADGARSSVPLYDASTSRRTNVDPEMFFLRSAAFPVRHPEHGYLRRVVLRGYYGTTVLDMQRAPSGGSFVAEVEPDFDIVLAHPSTDSFATLYATDACGNRYPVGTFSMVEATTDAQRVNELVLVDC